MLLKDYKYKLINISCLPTSAELNALVEFSNDIKEVLPYLNAVLNRATYSHEIRTLDFVHKNHHLITMEPESMKVTGVTDEKQARQIIDSLVNKINETWESRENIEPIFESVRPVAPLEILALLPKTNCGDCGEPTCLAFCLKVISEHLTIEDCTELAKKEWAKSAIKLNKLVNRRQSPKEAS